MTTYRLNVVVNATPDKNTLKLSALIAQLGKIYLERGDTDVYSACLGTDLEANAFRVNRVETWPGPTKDEIITVIVT